MEDDFSGEVAWYVTERFYVAKQVRPTRSKSRPTRLRTR
jgi:hypothetical protein